MIRSPRYTPAGHRLSPTRRSVLRLIESKKLPSSVPQLAETSELHENTIRWHVQALWQDGLLTRTKDGSHGVRGRPAWLWSATPPTPSSPYAALAGVLAKQLSRTSSNPQREARDAGLDWGRSLATEHRQRDSPSSTSPKDSVISLMREQGFAPETAPTGEILLRQCPLIEVANEHPEIVCTVHLGMIEGALESTGTGDSRAELLPFTSANTCTLLINSTQPAPSTYQKQLGRRQ